MKRILHISDLHFWRVRPDAFEPFIAAAKSLAPDIVVASGDFTQRARSGQFRDAADFLCRLDCKAIVVPGNHDIPLFNVFLRAFRPYGKYREHISPDIEQTHADGEVAVYALNSTRNFEVKHGRISAEQADAAAEFFSRQPADAVRIVVTHHPFDVSKGMSDRNIIRGDIEYALKRLSDARADMYLAGHMHGSFVTTTWERYKLPYNAVIANAGTPVSTRLRGNPLSFNELIVSSDAITVGEYAKEEGSATFELAASRSFTRGNAGWSEADPTP